MVQVAEDAEKRSTVPEFKAVELYVLRAVIAYEAVKSFITGPSTVTDFK
jgi:hypothetical protein